MTISTVTESWYRALDGKKEGVRLLSLAGKRQTDDLNATNAKTITKVLKSPHIDDWAGKRIVLGVEMVAAFGDRVEAIRVQKKAA